MNNLLVSLNGEGRASGKQSVLEPGRRFNMTPGLKNASKVRVTYASHGGLARAASFDLTKPLFLPDRFRFSNAAVRMAPGGSGKATAFITNPSNETLKCRVTLDADLAGVTLDPASRNIIIKPGETARVALTLRTAKGLAPAQGAATATLSWDDSRFHTLFALLPVIVH